MIYIYKGWNLIYTDDVDEDDNDIYQPKKQLYEEIMQARTPIEQNFEVQRLATTLVKLLEDKYPTEFASLMKDDQTKNWWNKYKKEALKAEQMRLERVRKDHEEAELRKAALEKLTDEERDLFGIKEKTKRGRRGTR